MLKRSLLIIFSAIGITFGGAAVLSPAPVFAETPQEAVCSGVGAGTGTGDCSSGITLASVVKSVIRIFSIIIGVFAVIMIIIAGFKYVVGGGDQSSVTSAKQSLLYAVIGLVVVALSQAFVEFILDNIT